MTEGKRTVFIFHLAEVGLRLLYINKGDNDECGHEDGDTGYYEGSYRCHGGLLGQCADEDTDEHGGQRAGKRVERAACLDELVALVSAATEQVEHGVNDGVEHAHAETADERAEEVDKEVEGGGIFTADDDYIGTCNARQQLDAKADGAHGEGDEGGFFVTVTDEHVACRDTHEKVSGEVHKVTGHASPFILESPDVAEGGCHVGHERNHREDEEHRDDSDQ